MRLRLSLSSNSGGVTKQVESAPRRHPRIVQSAARPSGWLVAIARVVTRSPGRTIHGRITAVPSSRCAKSIRVLDQEFIAKPSDSRRILERHGVNRTIATAASGHLLVVSAPSGGGKTSLVRALMDRAGSLCVSTSHTTRARRSGEQDGVDYYFIDEPRFTAMVAAGEFLEHARVFDHYYGTARAPVTARLAAGDDVILEIDWQGARKIRAVIPATISIFILPPSIEELQRRLTKRGDKAETIARRMRDAVNEMSHFGEYDYLVINDDFERAVTALGAIIVAARLRLAVQSERHAEMLSRLVAP